MRLRVIYSLADINLIRFFVSYIFFSSLSSIFLFSLKLCHPSSRKRNILFIAPTPSHLRPNASVTMRSCSTSHKWIKNQITLITSRKVKLVELVLMVSVLGVILFRLYLLIFLVLCISQKPNPYLSFVFRHSSF